MDKQSLKLLGKYKITRNRTITIGEVSYVIPFELKDGLYIISGIGREIWNSLRQRIPFDDLIDSILDKYLVDKSTVVHDIYDFLGKLADTGLITEANTTDIHENRKRRGLNSSEVEKLQSVYFENQLPYKVFMELTYNCNLFCKHCYLNHDSVSHDQLHAYFAKQIIDELRNHDVIELFITGGEAFLNPDAVDIIQHACETGLIVTVLTNGTLIPKEMFELISQIDLNDVRISLYGPQKNHDTFVGMEGAFSQSLRSLKEFRNHHGIGTASIVLTTNDLDQIRELVDILDQEKIRFDISPVIFPTLNRGYGPLHYRIDLRLVKKLYEEFGVRVGGDLCTAGISRFRITPKGIINPCEMLRHITLGDLKSHTFRDILQSEVREKWIRKFHSLTNENCQICNLQKYCFNCIGIAYLETGNIEGRSNFACNYAKAQAAIRNKSIKVNYHED